MKTQELKIEAPEGYEVDWDNSSNNTIRFKPVKKKITYKDICRELFLDKPSWRLRDTGVIGCANCTSSAIIHHSSISTSYQQLEQLLALNKLMNVAVYLNSNCNKIPELPGYWYIYADGKELRAGRWVVPKSSLVAFRLEELAYEAIDILGEEEVKKALGIFE